MGLTYLALGDSISCILANGKNFPWLVRDYIESNYMPIKYINKAVGGLSSRTLLGSMHSFCNIDADIVTICIGRNDSSQGAQNVPIAEFKSNLKAIISHLRGRNPNCRIILCTSPATNTEYINPYRNVMEEISQEDSTYISKFHEVLTDTMLLDYDTNDDTLHPNEAGHQIIFGQLIVLIDKLIKSFN